MNETTSTTDRVKILAHTAFLAECFRKLRDLLNSCESPTSISIGLNTQAQTMEWIAFLQNAVLAKSMTQEEINAMVVDEMSRINMAASASGTNVEFSDMSIREFEY